MSTLRQTRIRLPASALDFTRLAADLASLREAMTTTNVSFANAWPEEIYAVTSALVAVINDVDAAVDAADAIMGSAVFVANVAPSVDGLATAAAFQRFKALSDEAPVLTDIYNLLTRMAFNIATGNETYGDANYPLQIETPINPARPGTGIYDLAT